MFTGLIEEVGTMRRVGSNGEAMVLTIEASKVLQGVNIGDSIAINGVCLTVTQYDSTSFSADVMPQTFRHTNLRDLRSGEKVNLERAMQAGGRFGGHIVQGHVDTTGVIVARKPDANAVVLTVKPNEEHVFRHLIAQGSVTLDGISLTVAWSTAENFAVSIIPHTLKETALQWKQPGATVNIETDILGKYVDHLLRFGQPEGKRNRSPESEKSRLTEAFLADHGF